MAKVKPSNSDTLQIFLHLITKRQHGGQAKIICTQFLKQWGDPPRHDKNPYSEHLAPIQLSVLVTTVTSHSLCYWPGKAGGNGCLGKHSFASRLTRVLSCLLTIKQCIYPLSSTANQADRIPCR